MSGAAVITDSTSYLPAGWADARGIVVVPVQVLIDGRAHDETQADQADLVIHALTTRRQVTTSRPSPARFADAYARAAEAGAEFAVVVTLSAALSGTWESARIAANTSPIPVHVIDSEGIGMGVGWCALTAADARDADCSADEIFERVREVSTRMSTFFYVDTLEYLRRGGRIGNAAARIGDVLQVKPLLSVVDGRVELLEKVRTESRGLTRLIEQSVAVVGDAPARIAVHHIAAPERAEGVLGALQARLPQAEIVLCPVGGVIGAHVGPGMVGVAISR